MIEPINMSECMNAEMQHEIDAIATERKWHKICKKLRAEGRIK